MKKLVSVLLAVMMLAGSMSAFAEHDELFAALRKPQTNGEARLEFSAVLHEPLELFNALTEQSNQIISMPEPILDAKRLAEGLFDTTVTLDIRYQMSDDYKKMQMSMVLELNLPLDVNENFKNTTFGRMGYWYQLDLTDAENPVYQVISKSPVNSRYLIQDMSQMLKEDGMMNYYQQMFSRENMERKQGAMISSLMEYADISVQDGKFVVTMDDDAAKAYMMTAFNLTNDEMVQAMTASENVTDEVKQQYLDAQTKTREVMDKLRVIRLFGDDGIRMEFTLDQNGKIQLEDSSIHFNANVYELVQAFGGQPDPLTPENSQINFTLKGRTIYHSSDEPVVVDLPELTEINSYNPMAQRPQPQNYVPPTLHLSVRDTIGEGEDMNFRTEYIPLVPLMGEYQINYDDISCADGVITVKAHDPISGFETLEFREYSDVVIKDGESFSMTKPVIESNGRAFVPNEFISEVMGDRLISTSISYMSVQRGINCSISRKNPLFQAKTES